MTAGRAYGGVPAEQRQAERRRRLLDAALDIIGTQGWSAMTVRAVCRQARVGPRFFYELFTDLDDLAVATHDEVVQTAIGHCLTALHEAPDDLPAQVGAAVRAIVTEVTDDPRKARLVFARAHGSEALMQRRFTAMRQLAGVVAAQAKVLVRTPGTDERVVNALALVLTGGVAELVLVWLDGDSDLRIDLDRDELIDLCVQTMLTLIENLARFGSR